MKPEASSLKELTKLINHSPKPLGCSKGGHKKEVYSNSGHPNKGRKVSSKQSTLP